VFQPHFLTILTLYVHQPQQRSNQQSHFISKVQPEHQSSAMPHQIARAVHMLSAAHGTSTALRTGKTSLSQLAHASFFSPQHFPKFLGATMLMGGVTGYNFMAHLKRSDQDALVYAE